MSDDEFGKLLAEEESLCWVYGCGEQATHSDLIGVYQGLPVSALVCRAHCTSTPDEVDQEQDT